MILNNLIKASDIHDVLIKHVGIGAQTNALNKIVRARMGIMRVDDDLNPNTDRPTMQLLYWKEKLQDE